MSGTLHSYINQCSFLFILFTDFDCSATACKLKKELGTLTKLKYDALVALLFANDVITNEERKIIDKEIGEKKMIHLIAEIIIPSLKGNNSVKYKGFLEALEGSDDCDQKLMAEKLGKLIMPSKKRSYLTICVQLISLCYILFIIKYIIVI